MSAYLTVNFKLLSAALKLNRSDVVDIVASGGLSISKSRADLLLRGAGATKNASGNSERVGERIKRTADIKEDEFRAFCVGLKPWLDNINDMS